MHTGRREQHSCRLFLMEVTLHLRFPMPGASDVFRFEAKIMDDLVRYHHRDLILLVLFFTLIYFHFVSFRRSSSGGHEESRRI